MEDPIQIAMCAIHEDEGGNITFARSRRLAQAAISALEAAGWRLAPPVGCVDAGLKYTAPLGVYPNMHGAMKTWGEG